MKINHIRTLIVFLTMWVSFQFETASAPRLYYLIGLFNLLMVLPYVRGKHHERLGWTLLLDIAVVYGLNVLSRFNINYLYLSLFLWILIEAALWHPFVRGITLSVMAIATALMCFANTLAFGINYQLISQMIFSGLFYALLSGTLFLYASYTRQKSQTDHLNALLTARNEALESANFEIENLTRLKERTEIARNLHDTLGHELTGHIMSLEMLKLTAKAQPMDKTMEGIQNAINQSREILRAMRDVVGAHKEMLKLDALHESLRNKLDQYQSQTGITIHLSYGLYDERLEDEVADAIYKIVIESATNTAKHSKAKNLWVSIQALDEGIALLKIVDDGGCISPFVKGNGLRFIETRIKRLAGDVTFECGESRFAVVASIPMKPKEAIHD